MKPKISLITVMTVLLLAEALGVEAQQAEKQYRVGFLATAPPEASKVLLDAAGTINR